MNSIVAGIELTTNCNFNCQHCYIHNENNTISTLKLPDFIKMLDFLTNTKIISIFFTGGEPFLLKNFIQYYLAARRKGFLVTILTNGYLLNTYTIESFRVSKPFNIEMSLYGMSNETYKKVTGIAKAYDVIIENIELLLCYKIPLRLKYIIIKDNIHEVAQFVEYCKCMKIDYELFPALLPTVNNGKIDIRFRLSKEDINYLKKNYPDKIIVFKENIFRFCDAELGKLIYINSEKKLKGCPTLYKSFNFDWLHPNIKDFEKTLCQIKNNISCTDYFYCPAWEEVEDKHKIQELLSVHNKEKKSK